METYAFLPREAVTAFLMRCPQCSTSTTAVEPLWNPSAARAVAGFCPGANVADQRQWPTPFACSTPVKHGEAETLTAGPDKENDVSANKGQRWSDSRSNKRKRTMPMKRRDVPCHAVQVTVAGESSTSSGTLKNSSGTSTLVLSSSSSPSSWSSLRTERSGSSTGCWWRKRVTGLSRVAGTAQPLDLSSSPVTAILQTSSSAAEDFFYKRTRVRRRRVRPKRLNRSCLQGRYGGVDDYTSVSEAEEAGVQQSDRDDQQQQGEKMKNVAKRYSTASEDSGEEDVDGPRPAKIKRKPHENNNDDNYLDKSAAATAKETALQSTGDQSRGQAHGDLGENDGTTSDEPEEIQVSSIK